MTTLTLDTLYRYPVKGPSPETIREAALTPNDYFPGDRLFAIENGPSGFDPLQPRHQPKIKYLMLMRDEALARLDTRFDEAAGVLTIRHEGALAVEADLASPEGCRSVEGFLKSYMADSLRGEPRLLTAPSGYRFTDSPRGYVSLVNLASVTALEGMTGAAVDPLRFRANLYVTGLEPWAELDLVDRILAGADGLRLRIISRTVRCAATNVDPATGIRDLSIPRTLHAHLGHADCGVYAEVLEGGRAAIGDRLTFGPT